MRTGRGRGWGAPCNERRVTPATPAGYAAAASAMRGQRGGAGNAGSQWAPSSPSTRHISCARRRRHGARGTGGAGAQWASLPSADVTAAHHSVPASTPPCPGTTRTLPRRRVCRAPFHAPFHLPLGLPHYHARAHRHPGHIHFAPSLPCRPLRRPLYWYRVLRLPRRPRLPHIPRHDSHARHPDMPGLGVMRMLPLWRPRRSRRHPSNPARHSPSHSRRALLRRLQMRHVVRPSHRPRRPRARWRAGTPRLR